jgi:hypothetical protein
MRIRRWVLAAAVVFITACGSAGGTSTSALETATTTPGATSTTAPTTTIAATGSTAADGSTVGFEDIPQECLDALVTFLQAIEPVVEDFDLQQATMDDIDAFGREIEDETEEYEQAIDELDCPDIDPTDREGTFEAMVDLAEREAPGTVAYVEWIRTFSESFGDGEASGDCETDIAALEAIIAENAEMSDLQPGQIAQATALVTSVGTNCPPERAEEFFSRDDVEEFMGE